MALNPENPNGAAPSGATIVERSRQLGGRVLPAVKGVQPSPKTETVRPSKLIDLNIDTITLQRPFTNLYSIMKQLGARRGSFNKVELRARLKKENNALITVKDFIEKIAILEVKKGNKSWLGLFTAGPQGTLRYVPHMHSADVRLLERACIEAPNIRMAIAHQKLMIEEFNTLVRLGKIQGREVM